MTSQFVYMGKNDRNSDKIFFRSWYLVLYLAAISHFPQSYKPNFILISFVLMLFHILQQPWLFALFLSDVIKK